MADDSEFSLGTDGEGRPAILWQGSALGQLARGRTLMEPAFRPARAVAGLEGDALRDVTTRAEAWIKASLEKAMGGIVALQQLAQQPDVDGNVRALAVQLADAGGIAGRHYLDETLKALPKEARGAARKGGIVFGALDVYHHAALKPAAAKWRAALFAARDDKPMPELPPESAVHLKEWKFATAADCRNAGYRSIGDEHVRIDLAERVIKKAHEARGQALSFGMDMAFATSLGLSEAGLKALMRDAGFRGVEAPTEKAEDTETPPQNGEVAAVAIAPADGGGSPPDTASEAEAPLHHPTDGPPPRAGEELVAETVMISPEPQSIPLTWWRWVGLPKPRPREQQHRPQQKDRPERPKGKSKPRPDARPERAAPPKPAPTHLSSLALQLAALKEKL